MRILIAPQEFKGTLTAAEAAEAIADGVRQVAPAAEIDTLPMADGGPGTVDAVVAAAGGRFETATVRGPLGEPVEARWGVVESTAVIEMAAAAGLTLVPEGQRDVRAASTYGVGELLRAALDADCERLIVGLGGSATNDGGAGMAQALGVRFLDADGEELRPGGAELARLDRIDVSGIAPRLRQVEVVAAADVRNPLCGPEGASLVYGPQKGADEATARELEAALRRYGEIVERDVGVPVLDVPGAGAAGGLGAALVAFCGARIEPGVEVVAEVVALRGRLEGCDLVLTGEGRLDGQTGYGKTVAGVARMARASGVPALAVAGALGDGWGDLLQLGVEGVEAVVPSLAGPEEAMARPASLLATAAARALAGWTSVHAIARGDA